VKRRRPVVAIDGPAGAGKTTVTRKVAERLGYLVVDTGALYRCVALCAKQRAVSWDDAEGVSAVAAQLADTRAIEFRSDPARGQRVLLDGEDVSEAIRTQDISEGASKVSAIAGVRDALLQMQRSAGEAGGVVLEGRDIGTVVFPDADAKFYLTADVGVRAVRRYEELRRRGLSANLDTVREEVAARDRRDTLRPVAPLRQATDAVRVDTSTLDIEQVVERIVTEVHAVERSLGERVDS